MEVMGLVLPGFIDLRKEQREMDKYCHCRFQKLESLAFGLDDFLRRKTRCFGSHPFWKASGEKNSTAKTANQPKLFSSKSPRKRCKDLIDSGVPEGKKQKRDLEARDHANWEWWSVAFLDRLWGPILDFWSRIHCNGTENDLSNHPKVNICCSLNSLFVRFYEYRLDVCRIYIFVSRCYSSRLGELLFPGFWACRVLERREAAWAVKEEVLHGASIGVVCFIMQGLEVYSFYHWRHLSCAFLEIPMLICKGLLL